MKKRNHSKYLVKLNWLFWITALTILSSGYQPKLQQQIFDIKIEAVTFNISLGK